MDEPVCLFAYGTLRKEYGSTFYKMHAEEMEWIQRGKVPGVLYDIGEYPGAVPPLAEQHSIIIGDVFRLKQGKQFLQLLDKYENYDPLNTEGSEYLRMQ